jgi:hypothetical protein
MGGRANPLQDAAAMQGIGQTERAKKIVRQRRGTFTSQVEVPPTWLVVSGESAPSSALVLQAA